MKVYSVAIGNLPSTPPFLWTKETLKAMEIIKKLDGVVAIHLHHPYGTLLLFESRMKAIAGRNELNYEQIQTGKNICEFEWDREKNELRETK